MKPSIVCAVLTLWTASLYAQSFLGDINAQHDPCKRAERALAYADDAFDRAREAYNAGNIKLGNARLDDFLSAVQASVNALGETNKGKYYKKVEQRVSFLGRRLQTLTTDISVEERGWAEYIARKIDEMHNQLIAGVMRK